MLLSRFETLGILPDKEFIKTFKLFSDPIPHFRKGKALIVAQASDAIGESSWSLLYRHKSTTIANATKIEGLVLRQGNRYIIPDQRKAKRMWLAYGGKSLWDKEKANAQNTD